MKIPVYVITTKETIGDCHAIAEVNVNADHRAVVGRITSHKYPLTDPRSQEETAARQEQRYAELKKLSNGWFFAVETVRPSEYLEATQFWERVHTLMMKSKINGHSLSYLETAFIGLIL